MLERTFMLFQSISKSTEEKLKTSRIFSWDDFLNAKSIECLSEGKLSQCRDEIKEAKIKLKKKDFQYFIDRLPPNQHFRLYELLKKNVCFLDIETTGLSKVRNRITAISGFDGKKTHTFVAGQSLDEKTLKKYLSQFKMFVTFNGGMFDLPFISEKFPSIRFDDAAHMDLRWLAKRVGLTGGLKRIEVELNIGRSEDIEGMSGSDAVRLWKKWENKGDEEALNKLIKYNQEDVNNLLPLTKKILKLVDEKENKKP